MGRSGQARGRISSRRIQDTRGTCGAMGNSVATSDVLSEGLIGNVRSVSRSCPAWGSLQVTLLMHPRQHHLQMLQCENVKLLLAFPAQSCRETLIKYFFAILSLVSHGFGSELGINIVIPCTNLIISLRTAEALVAMLRRTPMASCPLLSDLLLCFICFQRVGNTCGQNPIRHHRHRHV